ncbi:MAG: hypothetical protein Kow0092_23430 [Deferrisomatales bacterium]
MSRVEGGVRIFFFHEDGGVEEVSPTVFAEVQAFARALPRCAGGRVRFLLATAGEGITPLWCGFLHFDARGYRDREVTARRHRVTASALRDGDDPSGAVSPRNVVDARPRLARRWLAHRFSWAPTPEDLRKLAPFFSEPRRR